MQVLGHRADRAASKVLKADMAVPKKAGASANPLSNLMRNVKDRSAR